MSVEFIDNSKEVEKVLNDILVASLYESAALILEQTQKNSRVASGQTKNSWTMVVDETKLEAIIGNPLENAIWEEFGTGEYALHGDGRKGGWSYQDENGTWHHTFGKRPNRALFSAFVQNTAKIKQVFERNLKVLKKKNARPSDFEKFLDKVIKITKKTIKITVDTMKDVLEE